MTERHASLAKRIIPSILHKQGALVKGKKFINDRVVGRALQSARIHALRSVDEIIVLDITATEEGREPDYQAVSELSEKCFSPLTVGGGVKTVEHVRKLLRAGADKVCIGTAHENIKELSDEFGSQCIAASLDAKPSHTYTDISLSVHYLEEQGAGEILLQSVNRDGTMEGYDLRLIREVSNAVNIPVIASGGCGTPEHAYEAIQAGASAVAIGAMFSFTDETPASVAKYLSDKGVTVRIH